MKSFPKHFTSKFTSNGLTPSQYIIPWVQFETRINASKRSKYGQIKIIDSTGIKFDSLSEFVRWRVLLGRKKRGLISNLRRQVSFHFRRRTYVADFTYICTRTGMAVFEDVKSPALLHSPRFREAQYLIKRHHNIDIKVVEASWLTK